MIFSQQDPGHWLTFSKRADNVNLPIQELTRKYNKEKLLFENYVTNFQQMEIALRSQQSLGFGGAGIINDSNIYRIVDAWFVNKIRTEAQYGPIGSWDVSRVTDMYQLFEPSTFYTIGKNVVDGFNEDISAWDVSNVSEMSEMFSNQTIFNQPLDSWDVSNVRNMTYMFSGATAFDQPLNSWDVSNAVNMEVMFEGATSFNQDLSSWNVSNVTDMGGMFWGATLFDGNITSWNVSNAVGVEVPGYGMSRMFNNAANFNQNISGWIINSGVTSFLKMFEGATSFDQNLGNWNIAGIDTAEDMFLGVTLSTANYSSLLIGWAADAPITGPVKFSGGNSQYSTGAAAAARAELVLEGWIITDGGQA